MMTESDERRSSPPPPVPPEANVPHVGLRSRDDIEARIALLLDRAPPGLLNLALRRRYLALALAVNVPGNSIIGGGGGIMLLAGMSGLFAPVPTALAVILAVSPVPLAVALFGA